MAYKIRKCCLHLNGPFLPHLGEIELQLTEWQLSNFNTVCDSFFRWTQNCSTRKPWNHKPWNSKLTINYLVVTKEPDSGSLVVLVVSNVEIVSSCPQYLAILTWTVFLFFGYIQSCLEQFIFYRLYTFTSSVTLHTLLCN